jgi:hypothetical protein
MVTTNVLVNRDTRTNKYLIDRNYNEAFIEIIPYHDKIHPALNDVSLVYLDRLMKQKGICYVLTIARL